MDISEYKLKTDEELFECIQSNDRLAFDVLFARYWELLYAESFKRLKNFEQIEELVQDVFSDLWFKKDSKKILNVRGYLMMATRYQVFAIYRKEKNHPKFEEPLAHMAFYNINADSLANEKDLKRFVAAWMASQPPRRGEIFRLKSMEGLSTREISKMLNLSQKTVQNQLTTCYKLLKKFINDFFVY